MDPGLVVLFFTYGYQIFQLHLLHYSLFTEFFLHLCQKLTHICKCGLLLDSILPLINLSMSVPTGGIYSF